MDLDLNQFTSKNDTLTHNNNLMVVSAALLLRYRVIQTDLYPYFFAGPGITYNEYRSNKTAQLDETYDILYIPINSDEVDFLTEGGLGIALAVGEGANLFIQGKCSIDFTSIRFANFSSMESPILIIPIEMGILVGY